MAEGEKATSKITGFLAKDTAGLPNWAWIVVVGAGLAAAYIIPKFMNKQSQSSSSTDSSGLGLAIDPTTGLPYAVEGLVPGGGLAGDNSGLPPLPGGCPQAGPEPTCTSPQVARLVLDANGCWTWQCKAPAPGTPPPPGKCPPTGKKPKCPHGCHAAYETDKDGCKKWACHKNGGSSPCTSSSGGGGGPGGGDIANTPTGGLSPQFATLSSWPGTNTVAARRGLTDIRMENLNGTTGEELEPGSVVRVF